MANRYAKLKAGDAVIIPAAQIHDACNTGTGPLKLAGISVAEKRKPWQHQRIIRT